MDTWTKSYRAAIWIPAAILKPTERDADNMKDDKLLNRNIIIITHDYCNQMPTATNLVKQEVPYDHRSC